MFNAIISLYCSIKKKKKKTIDISCGGQCDGQARVTSGGCAIVTFGDRAFVTVTFV